jgi:hypothetical protein
LTNKTAANSILILFSILIIFASCGKQKEEWKGTIEVEDGVTVVKNPGEPIYPENIFNLEEDLTIAGEEGKEEQMFMNIVSIDVSEDGTIYLLDGKAANIKVFDSSGRFLKTIGKRGQGPGEFGRPESFSITPREEIAVNDSGRRSIQFLDMDGNFLRQILVNQPFFTGPKFISNGDMIASYAIFGEDFKVVLDKLDSELEPLFTFATIPMLKPPKVHIFLYQFVYDLRWDVTSKDEIIWGALTTPEYELYIHNQDGKLIRKITKEYDPVEITNTEYEKMMKEWFGRIPTSDRWEFIIPKNYPPFHTFILDDEGRIFVKKFEEVEQSKRIYAEVFDPQGRYITDIIFPINMLPGLFKEGKLYTIEEDEEGYRVVKRYKVKWDI